MFKTILVPITGTDSDFAALNAAHGFARLWDGHIHALFVKADAVEFATRTAVTDMGVSVITPEVFQALEEEEKDREKTGRANFSRFCKEKDLASVNAPTASRGVTAEWEEVRGRASELVAKAARFCDLVVVGRSDELPMLALGDIGSLLVGCGRPVVMTKGAAAERPLGTVAIAWKETAESARAVAAAMPLLARAGKLVVLTVAENEDSERAIESATRLGRALSWHGLKPEIRCIMPRAHSIGDALFESALGLDADLLVMGAYSHSRVRELVLGGVTRQTLLDVPMTVFMAH